MNNKNQLRAEVLATAALQPFPGTVANSRMQMMGSHVSQALVVRGATTRRILTGAEREFGRFTFNVKMPVNAEILRIIPKYRTGVGRNSIRENPLDVIVYMDMDTGELGILSVPSFSAKHQHFGFRYKERPVRSRLTPGMAIPAGTIIADSPNVDDLGNYRMGVETNVLFASMPGIIEDGVIVSEDYVNRLTATGYETRTASWGSKMYPLNLYGDDNEYKPFPDIGERIRDDGLLFALRRYDDLMGAVEMTPAALREVNYSFDTRVYAEPGAKVVDVAVRSGARNGSLTPEAMETQTRRYYEATLHFHHSLMEVYKEQKRRLGHWPRITPEFQRVLVEGLVYSPDPNRSRATLIYKLQPLDDWRVDVTFEYDVKPVVGSKLTGWSGDKGVICSIRKTEDMPVDEEGNRADAIMDGDSTIKRMNVSRMYEQYINITSRTVTNRVRAMAPKTEEEYLRAWDYLLGYYRIVSPGMEVILTTEYDQSPRHHVDEVIKDGIYLWFPTDNPVYLPEMIQALARTYPVHLGPVTYRGESGQMRRTKKPMFIGSIYVMLLEKTGVDCSGVSSAKLNHFGITAKLTNADKFSFPRRPQPVRGIGESEGRLMVATVGSEMTAEILEMSNSPQTHKNVSANILRAEKPTDIESVVDRTIAPRGRNRSLIFIKHALQCVGIGFHYVSADESNPVIYTE